MARKKKQGAKKKSGAKKKNAKKKAKQYVGLQKPKEIDAEFYRRFDPDFLVNKAEALVLVTDEVEDFKRIVEKAEGDPGAVEGKFIEALRADVHFTEFHQFEALMALLLAPWQPLPHWVYMTTYTTREVKEANRLICSGDVSTLTGGRVKSMRDFVRWSVYYALASKEEDQRARWDENLDNVTWILQYLGRRYDAAAEYNAYKHGVRVFTGRSAITVTPDETPSQTHTVAATKDSISFMEIKKKDDEHHLYLTTRHFNPIHSLNNLVMMGSILGTIKSTRLAKIRGESGAQINTFFSLDRDKLMGLDPGFQMSMSM